MHYDLMWLVINRVHHVPNHMKVGWIWVRNISKKVYQEEEQTTISFQNFDACIVRIKVKPHMHIRLRSVVQEYL